MKTMILIILVTLLCSLSGKERVPPIKEEKRHLFGNYIVITGSCDEGSAIIIKFKGKIVFKSYGGDGRYVDVDTLLISKDKKMDFVFSYAFDDYTNLGMVVSSCTNKKYKIISITDNLYKSYDCSVPYKVAEQRIKDFILTDIDMDGHKDILTIAQKNQDGSVSRTECSVLIMHNRLMELILQHN